MTLFKKHVPIMLQMEAAECGAASLCMILAYYGRYVDLSEMRRACHVTRDGCSMRNIMEAAGKYGLRAVPLRSGAGMEIVQLPAIAFWKGYHFIVVERVTDKYVYVCDPAAGRKKIPRSEFAKHFSGLVLSLLPGAKFKRGGTPFARTVLKEYQLLLKKQWRPFTYITLEIVMLNLTGLLLPALTSLFVDFYLPSAGYTDITDYFLLFVTMLALQFMLMKTQKNAVMAFTRQQAAKMSGDIITKIFKLPASYFQARNHYALVSHVCGLDGLASFVAAKLVPITLGLFFSFIYFALLLYYSVYIGIIVFALIVTVLSLYVWIMSETRAAAHSVDSYGNAFYAAVGQCVKLFDTIKCSAMERQMMESSIDCYVSYANAVQRTKEWQALAQAIPVGLPVLLQAVTVFVGCAMVIDGKMSIGNIMACQTLAMSIYAPLAWFLTECGSFQTKIGTIRYLKDIVHEEEDKLAVRKGNKLGKGTESAPGVFSSVEFRNVTFSYNSSLPPAVSNLSFKAEAGKSIALVGASGSGKSTVLRLLQGLYVPTEGEILFDGVPMLQTDRKMFCSSVAVIAQTPSLFEGTIKDNITLFDKTQSVEAVEKAAEKAEILSVVMTKKQGFNEWIKTGSSNLSGGEVQRLMIARALLRNPGILLMDEATSALDTIVEEKIMHNINDCGITRIIAAHRLSAIRDADEIIVLDKGKIAERGTHNELIAKENSIYSRLVLAER